MLVTVFMKRLQCRSRYISDVRMTVSGIFDARYGVGRMTVPEFDTGLVKYRSWRKWALIIGNI